MEAQMAAARPPTHHHGHNHSHSHIHHQQQKAANLARTFTKLLRRKRPDSAAAGAGAGAKEAADAPASVAGDDYDSSMDATTPITATAPTMPSLSKLKLSGNLAAAYSLDAFFRNAAEKKAAGAQPQQPSPQAAATVAAADSLLANLFAGVSAVKAAYAQLQLAQFPYDAEAIQSADAAVVAELTRLSDTKRRFLKDPAGAARDAAAAGNTALSAHAEEQRHLLKTYQITARKLEAELRTKDAELDRAKCSLDAELRAERAMEVRLHPGRTLASLDELHVSGLNPTHFLTALRHAVKSIRSFSKSMLSSMQAAGWDLAAAAAAVHPGVPLRRAGDAKFVFESYVAMKMFAQTPPIQREPEHSLRPPLPPILSSAKLGQLSIRPRSTTTRHQHYSNGSLRRGRRHRRPPGHHRRRAGPHAGAQDGPDAGASDEVAPGRHASDCIGAVPDGLSPVPAH